ncbi:MULTISPECIES: hypothetical protein [unclassified Brevibacterium]|uniref:hypothetical protein n=1 Tax=unclassified Brevibacterium TaxID=2614124 RepID=UPI001E4F7224|nr:MULTISPECIES: hypothetical protein [unclassified Brevibacterium]MCD1287312.1 hypothetical protein [Brevibacterium sp. CCUG 69071]MDK8436434.1 hypothetical protein [Brevibacterium sp. H-BE7]
MRTTARLEGAIRPGSGISFDAQNTMNGGYSEATPAIKRKAKRVAEEFVPAADLPDVLAMLGLLPPRPGRG